jgi:hypothetical protein
MEIAIIPDNWIQWFSEDFLRRYNLNILLSNVFVILLFVIFRNTLLEFLSLIPHYCLIDKLTGIECPVCGTTRAFCELSGGHLNNAFILNPTSILVAGFFVMQIPLRLISLVQEKHTSKINMISKYAGRLILIIILLHWLTNLLIKH